MPEQPEIPLATLVDLQRRLDSVETALAETQESVALLIESTRKLIAMMGSMTPEEGH